MATHTQLEILCGSQKGMEKKDCIFLVLNILVPCFDHLQAGILLAVHPNLRFIQYKYDNIFLKKQKRLSKEVQRNQHNAYKPFFKIKR